MLTNKIAILWNTSQESLFVTTLSLSASHLITVEVYCRIIKRELEQGEKSLRKNESLDVWGTEKQGYQFTSSSAFLHVKDQIYKASHRPLVKTQSTAKNGWGQALPWQDCIDFWVGLWRQTPNCRSPPLNWPKSRLHHWSLMLSVKGKHKEIAFLSLPWFYKDSSAPW